MRVRTLLSTVGLAVALSACAKPVQVETPRPVPQVVEKRPEPKPEVNYRANGYEVTLSYGSLSNVTYKFYQDTYGISSCLDLHVEGKDWLEICADNPKDEVNKFNNYTRMHDCEKGKKKENCTSDMFEDAQVIFDKWKKELGVESLHQKWLKKRTKPFGDYK